MGSSRRGFLLVNEGSDSIRIFQSHRIVDDHAEIGPAVNREGRIFECDWAENRVAYVLDALSVAADVVLAPHRLEFGAKPAEFIDEGLHLRRGSRTCRVYPEGAQNESRHTLPVILRGTGAGIKEHEAQDIALLRRQ
jgi:hypothetical protein